MEFFKETENITDLDLYIGKRLEIAANLHEDIKQKQQAIHIA